VLVSKRAGSVEGMRVLVDVQGLFAKRYDAQSESAWLVRPDQHIAARWRHFELQAVERALLLAIGSSTVAA
jgi:3-(3-hydroxy-phenyl)propionate hydroxylase